MSAEVKKKRVKRTPAERAAAEKSRRKLRKQPAKIRAIARDAAWNERVFGEAAIQSVKKYTDGVNKWAAKIEQSGRPYYVKKPFPTTPVGPGYIEYGRGGMVTNPSKFRPHAFIEKYDTGSHQVFIVPKRKLKKHKTKSELKTIRRAAAAKGANTRAPVRAAAKEEKALARAIIKEKKDDEKFDERLKKARADNALINRLVKYRNDHHGLLTPGDQQKLRNARVRLRRWTSKNSASHLALDHPSEDILFGTHPIPIYPPATSGAVY